MSQKNWKIKTKAFSRVYFNIKVINNQDEDEIEEYSMYAVGIKKSYNKDSQGAMVKKDLLAIKVFKNAPGKFQLRK